MGAALQGSVLKGEVRDILLLDVTPLTLGIETAGGGFEGIIPRNTTIPCRKSKVFTTAQDNQDMVRVHVLQGERQMSADNKSLGRLELHGLPPAPRGLPEIQVTFEIDANGIMNVSAKDLGTGKRQSMRIVSDSGLTEVEVESMIQQADRYRAEDQIRRDTVESRNRLDGLIYTTRRSLDEYGDLLDDEDIEEIQLSIREAENGIEKAPLLDLQRLHDELAKSAQLLAHCIYSSAQSEAQSMSDEEWLDDDDMLPDEDEFLDDDEDLDDDF
jgi:molecular chaperone DnaK